MGYCGEERGVLRPLIECFKTAFFHLSTWYQRWVGCCKCLGRPGFEWEHWLAVAADTFQSYCTNSVCVV